jgi:hypothetical protein
MPLIGHQQFSLGTHKLFGVVAHRLQWVGFIRPPLRQAQAGFDKLWANGKILNLMALREEGEPVGPIVSGVSVDRPHFALFIQDARQDRGGRLPRR